MTSLAKIATLGRYIAGSIAAATLAACSGGLTGYAPTGTAPMAHESGLTPLSAQRVAALTVPNYEARPVHPDHRASWVQPAAIKGKDLLYVGDWGTNDVYVFSYPSGTEVGTLTGFDEPYGMCLDKQGDVYISNFGSGDVVEYAYGGTTPINTYATNGYAIGCSISAKGDVSATDFYTSTGAGQVCVWKGGSGNPTCYSDSSACYYTWTFGYDHKGDLIGEGEYDSITFCVLASGGSTMGTLTPSGITVDFPAGVQWDGAYIGAGDQEAGGTYKSGVWEATLSGTTLSAKGPEIIFSDDCYGDYTDDVNPFFFGKKNVTAASTRRATSFAGPNLWCYDEGKGAVDIWKYPAGGDPIARITAGLTEPYGVAISIAK